MTLTVRRVGSNTRPFLNLLLWGMPGAGKTTLAAQAQDHPDLAPVLIADLEGGTLSIASRGDIDSVAITSTDQLDELLLALRAGSMKNDDGERYKTVIIDSGTNFANRALEEWVQRNTLRANKKGRGDADRTIDDVELQDYGKTKMQVRRVMTWYRDLPMNVIVTALARFEFPQGVDQRTAEPRAVFPDFSEKLSNDVSGLMDHVWYLYETDEGRELMTRRTGPYMAKTRGANFRANLPDFVANPDMVELYDLLCRSETADGFADAPETLPDDVPDDDPEYLEGDALTEYGSDFGDEELPDDFDGYEGDDTDAPE